MTIKDAETKSISFNILGGDEFRPLIIIIILDNLYKKKRKEKIYIQLKQ